jgi:hypothetical protein
VLAGEIPAEPVPLGVHSSLVSLVDESEAGLSLSSPEAGTSLLTGRSILSLGIEDRYLARFLGLVGGG